MSNFGSEKEGSGFNRISKEYKAAPTIENYVRLRRQQPNEEIEIATSGGIEFLFSFEEELRSQGFDPLLICGLLDADATEHSEVSLRLLEMLIERKRLEQSGTTHIVSRQKAISDTLVNYLIGCALDSLSWNDELMISRDLIVLIKHQLGALTSQYEVELEKRTKRSNAKWIAAQILAAGRRPTYRNIGHALGVQASTVMRWFPKGDFITEAKRLVPLVKDIIASDNKPKKIHKATRNQIVVGNGIDATGRAPENSPDPRSE